MATPEEQRDALVQVVAEGCARAIQTQEFVQAVAAGVMLAMDQIQRQAQAAQSDAYSVAHEKAKIDRRVHGGIVLP